MVICHSDILFVCCRTPSRDITKEVLLIMVGAHKEVEVCFYIGGCRAEWMDELGGSVTITGRCPLPRSLSFCSSLFLVRLTARTIINLPCVGCVEHSIVTSCQFFFRSLLMADEVQQEVREVVIAVIWGLTGPATHNVVSAHEFREITAGQVKTFVVEDWPNHCQRT